MSRGYLQLQLALYATTFMKREHVENGGLIVFGCICHIIYALSRYMKRDFKSLMVAFQHVQRDVYLHRAFDRDDMM